MTMNIFHFMKVFKNVFDRPSTPKPRSFLPVSKIYNWWGSGSNNEVQLNHLGEMEFLLSTSESSEEETSNWWGSGSNNEVQLNHLGELEFLLSTSESSEEETSEFKRFRDFNCKKLSRGNLIYLRTAILTD